MHKKTIIIFVFLALLGLSSAYLFSVKSNESEVRQGQTLINADKPTVSNAGLDKTGSYQEFSEENLKNSQNKIALFFHAPWCPQCRSIESDIQRNGVPTGYTILKVDYDTNQELRKKYGVTLQTTFVKVDNRGNALGEKYVAYDTPTISSVKQNYLGQ